jgi:hypothetical protein
MTLSPRHRLEQLIQSMARHLPVQLEGLLAHAKFTDGAAALRRFTDEHHVRAALAALDELEAEWLADQLLERWRAIGEPTLDPIAAIDAPHEIWVGVDPVRITVEVAVLGGEPGWEVIWDGATATTHARAVITASPSIPFVTCRAHVRARSSTGRVALVAVARIAVRRPAVTVREDRRRLVVADQQGLPAVGVRLVIGDVEHVTGPGGLVELEHAASRGAPLRVEGVAAGRIPDEG